MPNGLRTVVLAVLIGTAGIGATQKTRKPVVHTITIDAVKYEPASLSIAPGDSVRWVNKDLVSHTATSAKAGLFESGAIAPGKSWTHRFSTKGEVAFYCRFHQPMKGSLAVK